MSGNKQVLIITYYWPPSGGAGVQRWLKFSKYLPDFSVRPHVLTVDPAFANYPATDDSLSDDLSPEIRIYTTRARNYFKAYSSGNSGNPVRKSNFKNKIARFIRGNFFIPDPRKGWNNYACREAREVIQKEGIGSIITSGPPHSTHLIGRKLKRIYPDLNWIADFRDPWTDIYYYRDFYISPLAKRRDRIFELSILKEADKILTVGEGLKKLLEDKIPSSGNKIHIIPNGYDEADFSNIEAGTKSPEVLISYIGSISDRYPLESFLSAIIKVIESKPGPSLRLQFVGKLSDGAHELIKRYDLQNICEFIDYSTHSEAIKFICSSNILLLLIPQHEMNKLIVTGKIFEYIRSGNKILGIGPSDGDAAAILKDTESGIMINPGEIEEISKFIINKLDSGSIKESNKAVQKYERKELTSLLPDLL